MDLQPIIDTGHYASLKRHGKARRLTAFSEEDEGKMTHSSLPACAIKNMEILSQSPVLCVTVSVVAGGGGGCDWPGRRQVS